MCSCRTGAASLGSLVNFWTTRLKDAFAVLGEKRSRVPAHHVGENRPTTPASRLRSCSGSAWRRMCANESPARPASGAGVRSMRARPGTSSTRSPRPAGKRTYACSTGACNTAQRTSSHLGKGGIAAEFCSISSHTISYESPSSSPPEPESARKSENRLRETVNQTTEDVNELRSGRFFSKASAFCYFEQCNETQQCPASAVPKCRDWVWLLRSLSRTLYAMSVR